MRYIAELEHKVQTLQTEATTLSAQLTLLQVINFSILSCLSLLLIALDYLKITFTYIQRDATGLTSQNSELKFRLQAMEQQAQLRDGIHLAMTLCICQLMFRL